MSNMHFVNLDSSETAFFARELEHIKARSYDKLFPEYLGLSLFNVATDQGEGANWITYRSYEETGRAKIIANYADDLPRADIRGKEKITPVRSIGICYGFSRQDIRASIREGKGLDARLASAARRGNDQLVDDIIFYGKEEYGLDGLLNNPAIPQASVPADGTGGSTLWSSKTPDQVLRDLNLIVNDIVTNSNGVEIPNTLLLPLSQYTYIASTPRSAVSDTTILDLFVLSNPYIATKADVIPVPKLAGAGENGGDVMIAYRKDPDKIETQIPMPFMQYAPQERNLYIEILCESRIGSVIPYYPRSVNIGEGI